ncbi:MAG: hypothetical protein AAGH41_10255 [Pseudomonadota bacterium]
MKKVDSNTLIAVAALVTSVVAVFIAWDEARLQRQNQRASFLPIIDISGSVRQDPEGPSVLIFVSNRGHGVAYLKSFELLFEGEVIREWDELGGGLLTPELAQTTTVTWADPTGYFQAGEQDAFWKMQWEPEMANAFRAHFLLTPNSTINAADARACYCSVFGECWESTMLGEVEPKRVTSCPDRTDAMESLTQSYLAALAKRAPQ